MKRKIFSILFALVLALSLGLMTAVPASAEAGYSLHTMGTGIAEWSTEANFGSYSVKLDTGPSPGPTDIARIIVPIGDKTLSEVASVSYWAKVTATAEPLERYRPWVGIYLDDPVGGDGNPSTYEYYIQAEPMYAYPNGAFGGLLNTWEFWDSDDADHPLRWMAYEVSPVFESADYPYEAPLLSDYIDGSAVNYTTPSHEVQSFASREYGSLTVIKITFMAGYGTNWENFTGYVDDITINGIPYPLEWSHVSPIQVDDDRAQFPNAPFQTIQGAIDCASPDDTINVADGKYVEQVTVNQSVTLISDTGDYRTTETILTGSGPIFRIEADGITVQGFRFRDITGDSNDGAIQCGITARDIVIRSNSFTNLGGPAVFAMPAEGLPAGTGWLITDNKIDTVTGTDSSGLRFQKLTDSKISYNEISNTAYAGMIIDNLENVVVSGNTISNTPKKGIQVAVSSNVVIENNYITNTNTSHDADEGAITIYPDVTNIRVENNTLTANYQGFTVRDKAGSVAPDVHVNYNKIYGNDGFGVGNFAQGGGILDATKNWWGGVAGPQHSTNPYNAQATAAGSDNVTDNVDYLPWMIHTELAEGWNIYSTPIAPDVDSSGTIDKALDLWGSSSSNKSIAYYYNVETQWWDEPTSLTPLQAVYIKMAAAATIDVVVSSDATFPPSTDMYVGWNLVGPAELGKRLVDSALFDAYLGTGVAADLQGYSKALSPPLYQSNWTYLRGGDKTDKYFVPTEGYWVLMVNQGILGGVTTTPIKYDVP